MKAGFSERAPTAKMRQAMAAISPGRGCRARLPSRRLAMGVGARFVRPQSRGDAGYRFADIAVHEDAPARDGGGRARPSYVHAGVRRVAVPSHGVPEGVLDDDGRIVPDAQLQVQDAVAGVRLAERAVAEGSLVPSAILAERAVDAQVRNHGRPAARAAGNELARHPLVFLAARHLADLPLVVVRLVGAVAAALEQAVVPLRVEQPRLVEPCQLELVVDVGGEDEVVPPFEDAQEVEVGLADPCLVAVEQDGAAPPRPVGLQVGEGVEPARVHVGYPEPVAEVREVLVEALPGVRKARRGGEPGARAHQDRVAFVELSPYRLGRLLRRRVGPAHEGRAPLGARVPAAGKQVS